MKAGVARRNITPEEPVWMAGYAARTKPSEGKYHELFAKALVLEESGQRAALVTTDLIGFDREKAAEIKKSIAAAVGLHAHQVILSASHTHTGPEVRMKRAREDNHTNEAYSAELTRRITDCVSEAFGKLESVQPAFCSSSCSLAVNRRLPTANGIVMRSNPEGISDHEVSVLRLDRPEGPPLAVIFSYACHPTTLGDYLIGADYPGYAQDAIEAAFDGETTAMFLLGCAGDQKVRNVDGKGNFRSGPYQVAQSLGEELGRAVLLALGAPARPIDSGMALALEEIEAPLLPPPSREEAGAWLADSNKWRVEWAEEMVRIHDAGDPFRLHETMTLHALTLGDFALVGLSGEICVGYALRVKREHPARAVMVAGYTNGMIGYIPTAAMCPEGGYEVDGSYFYTKDRPNAYAPEVEDRIMEKVTEFLSVQSARPRRVRRPDVQP